MVFPSGVESVQSRAMADVRAEFTVEPFAAGAPGAHVDAAIAASRVGGLEPEIGPFATTVVGPAATVAEALRAITDAAFAAGATRISISVEAI